jgi:transcriptional regulator with XRE-family HTH domain
VTDASTSRRRLSVELRRLRVLRQLNQRQVAEGLDWSPSKMHRIEKADVSISVTDLRALLGYYGVVDPTAVDELVGLAKEGRKRSEPFSAYRDVLSPDDLRFFDFEREAASVAEVQLLVLPGLVQTDDYARALLMGVHGFSGAKADRLVQLRRERQRLLTAPHAPTLSFFVDESALHRPIGGVDVMRAQLSWLSHLADLPTVDLRVLPLSRGAHIGLRGSFVLLSFPDVKDPDVLFLENRRGDTLFRDEPEVVDVYRAQVDELRALSVGSSDLAGYLQRAADGMRDLATHS